MAKKAKAKVVVSAAEGALVEVEAPVRAGLVELPAVVAVIAEVTLEAPAPERWRVALTCPTPLLHHELVVEAKSEAEAKAKFMEANGICDSKHTWTVEKVA